MKKFVIAISVALVFIFGICVVSMATTEQTWPLKIWSQNQNGRMETYVVVDEETGVNYVVVASRTSQTGCYYNSVAITHRLNSNGTLYTSK